MSVQAGDQPRMAEFTTAAAYNAAWDAWFARRAKDREEIARIIDPAAFGNKEILRSLGSFDDRPQRKDEALAKADKILALQAQSRDAVIEECAKVAEDQRADDWFEVGKVAVATGKRIAAAIRSLKQPAGGE